MTLAGATMYPLYEVAFLHTLMDLGMESECALEGADHLLTSSLLDCK